MQISSYIKIQNLARVDELSSSSLIMTGLSNEQYISKTIAYQDLETQLYNKLTSNLFVKLSTDLKNEFERMYSLHAGQLSTQISANTQAIEDLISDLSDANTQIQTLKTTVESDMQDMKELSAFTTGIVVSSILKIANCQLNTHSELENFKNGLSVEVI